MLEHEDNELITRVGPGTRADWVEATGELRKAYVEHPELDPTLNGPL